MTIYMAAVLLFGDEDDDVFEVNNQEMRITEEFSEIYRILSRFLIAIFESCTGIFCI